MDAAAPVDPGALERLVRRSFGERTAVTVVQQIRPWSIARVHLDHAGEASVVIAKWLRSNPEGFRVERRQIATEAAALELMAVVAPGLTPALVGHDPEHDLLLVEDLAPRRTLHSMLSSGLTPAGIEGLHTFASTMGRLHARTARAATPGPWDPGARAPIGGEAATRLLDRLEELVPASAGVRSGFERAVAAIEDPGPFDAFSNGDSGANNCLVAADGGDGRLIDFEHACRRHALLDAAALHVPGSMWMTVADPAPLGIEETYRRAAGKAMPAVSDDEAYGFGLSAACALRALSKVQRFDKLDRRSAGHHSRPQLVTTLERAAATVARWDDPIAVGSWLSELAGALRARWPDADLAFPDDYTLREPFEPDH